MNMTTRKTILNCDFLKKRLPLAILAVCLPFLYTQAENRADSNASRGWYVGVEGGMPFGFSTFSSFGHDKTRIGWTAGAYGGYRFNPRFSVELSAKYGKMTLAAQECCVEQNYWLGIDGVRYNAGVLEMTSWQYSDVTSKVQMGQFGARLNINLLGFFHRTADSRWDIAVSPHVYALSTKTNLHTASNAMDMVKYSTDWHLGYGADLQIGYRLNSWLRLGIYSGLTNLTGSRMDKIPEYLHKNNFVWESGIRIGFCLSKKKKAETAPTSTPTYIPQEEPAPKEEVVAEEPTNKVEAEVVQPQVEEPVKLKFPTIYFAFNSTRISKAEESKLHDILDMLNEHPEANVAVAGWCDTMGSASVNKRISQRRANAVKAWLVGNGIDESRITATGCGSDYNAPSAAKARRVETTESTGNE